MSNVERLKHNWPRVIALQPSNAPSKPTPEGIERAAQLVDLLLEHSAPGEDKSALRGALIEQWSSSSRPPSPERGRVLRELIFKER